MDDLLRELRAADAELAALSDEQLLAFLRRLVGALDERPLAKRGATAPSAHGL